MFRRKNLSLAALLLLIVVTPIILLSLQQRQETRQRAAEVVSGNMVLSATFDSIGVEIKNTTASSGILEFKKTTEFSWRKGLDMWQAGGALTGSALLLDANTLYDIRVSYDGQTVQGQITTRAENIPAASSLIPTHFVRVDGSDANSGTADSPTGAWKTLNKAVQSAPTNAIVQVGPGSYDGLTVGRSTPITLKAQFPAVDENQNPINADKQSVIEPQVYSSPGQSIWQEVTLIGPQTEQPYTVWKWENVPKWPSDIFHLTVAASRTEQPERVAYWFPLQKNIVTGGTPNQYTLSSPEGWAEMLYVNKRYNYGFASYGSDVYLRLPGNRNPNNLFVWIQPSGEKDWTPKFTLGTTDTRISGFRFVKIGPKLTAIAQRMTIDHNLFYDAGIAVEGIQPGTYGTDHVIEKNRFTATSLVHPTGNVEYGIPWDFIKGSVWTPDNQAYFNRVGQGEEFSQIFFRGGANRMVIRRNIFEGAFNGIGVYNYSFDRYASNNIDVYENIFQNLADDALEPEFNVSNWRIWNNKILTVPVAMSTGPTSYGPMYYFRNEAWNLGASAAIKDVMGQRGIDSGLGFKYSQASSPPARLYVINNTFWSNHANAEGGAPYAGGPNSPENFYLRNNIFRMTRYAFLPSGMQKPVWDEDYNHFYTSDPARGIASLLTIAQYRSTSGQGAHTNTEADFHTSPDIWFQNATSGDIRLTNTAPLIDKGTSIPNIYDNYDAKSSYVGAAPDLGALEVGGTGIPVPTATPTPANGNPSPTSLPLSPTVTLTTTPVPPTPTGGTGLTRPTNLQAIRTTSTTVQLTWIDTSSIETKFLVTTYNYADDSTRSEYVSANESTHTVKDLTPSTTYQLKVFACTETICSSGATPVIVTTEEQVTPTVTPVIDNFTRVSFTNLKLHGIGNGGDSVTPNSVGNTSPQRPTRQVTVQLFDGTNTKVAENTGSLTYNSTTGFFAGSAVFTQTIASGPYIVKVKSPQFLQKTVPGIISITANQATTLPQISLITGDVNNDNILNILDFNLLSDCYSDLQPARNCDETKKLQTDITDDGSVNQFDYNLFIRELSVRSGA